MTPAEHVTKRSGYRAAVDGVSLIVDPGRDKVVPELDGAGTPTPLHLPRSPRTPTRWNISAAGRRHRVEILGASTRTVTWYVDDQLVAQKKSSQDDLHLQPGDGLDTGGSTPGGSSVKPPSLNRASSEATGLERPDVGIIHARFTGLGRPKRVTWHPGQGDVSTTARAMVATGGIDLDPAPGSPAALRAERIRRHPHRYAAVALAGGIAKVGIPVLLGFLAVRFTVSLPWPDLNLPSIPWPDWDLPSIPWPDWDLPYWAAPAWVTWLVDHVRYVWPIILAGLFARTEIKRQRQQDVLKAQPGGESVPDRTSLAASTSDGSRPPRTQEPSTPERVSEAAES